MKYLSLLFFSIVILSACGGVKNTKHPTYSLSNSSSILKASIVDSPQNSELEGDYKNMNQIFTDLKKKMDQPNILKEDIVRGWYLGKKEERKFGTPDTWVFKEDGLNSKWMSSDALGEGDLIDNQELCSQTAGNYVLSCLESSDTDCQYIKESHCECASGSSWKEEQGCILTTEKGSLVSINNAELEQGWYLGLPNEKKLNTPADWHWVERGKESVWQASGDL